MTSLSNISWTDRVWNPTTGCTRVQEFSSVWEVTLDANVEGGHSTQKPVEVMERPIRNHGGDVYDPFVGSGTTVIAAERQGRRCYAMELSPGYVDVVVARWQNYTGKTAILEVRDAE